MEKLIILKVENEFPKKLVKNFLKKVAKKWQKKELPKDYLNLEAL
jgi:hypothetical protein